MYHPQTAPNENPLIDLGWRDTIENCSLVLELFQSIDLDRVSDRVRMEHALQFALEPVIAAMRAAVLAAEEAQS